MHPAASRATRQGTGDHAAQGGSLDRATAEIARASSQGHESGTHLGGELPPHSLPFCMGRPRAWSRRQLVIGVAAATLLAEGLLMVVLPALVSGWVEVIADACGASGVAGLAVLYLTRSVPASPRLDTRLRWQVRASYVGGLLFVTSAFWLGRDLGVVTWVLLMGSTGLTVVLFFEPALARLERERDELKRLAMVARRTNNGIIVTDAQGRIEWVNEGWERLTGFTLDEARGHKPGVLLRAKHLLGARRAADEAARARMRHALTHGEGFQETLVNESRSGALLFVDLDVQPVRDEASRVTGFIGVQADVHGRELALERLRVRATVLGVLQARAPLQVVLDNLVETINDAYPDMLPSVLFVEHDRLLHGAARGLTDDYMRAINGVQIGPCVGACGAAAFSGELVITPDIETHPNWEGFRHLTRPQGLRSCWSHPVKSRRGVVMACLALYSRTPGEPSADQLSLIREAAELLGLALEQREVERENTLLRAALESAAEAVLVVDASGRIIFRNWALERLVDSLETQTVDAFVASVFEGANMPALRDALTRGLPWEGRLNQQGFERCFLVAITPAASGEVRGALLTMRDCSWPPPGNTFEKAVFETPSVERYVVIGSRHRFAARC
jgi:PAS domain S-box-containing protein